MEMSVTLRVALLVVGSLMDTFSAIIVIVRMTTQ
jgi:hypothetical protein